MSEKKKGGLFMSTRSASKLTKKIQRTPAKPPALPPVEVLSGLSDASVVEAYETEEFRGAWDNDIRFHVARNLIHLRKHRGMSQDAVAKNMHTSQSAVARAENALENMTLDTLARHVGSLDGLFFITIYPKEYGFQRPRPWWDVDDNPWRIRRVAVRRDCQMDQVMILGERSQTNTLALTTASLDQASTTYGAGA
jgi:hypothetical protein